MNVLGKFKIFLLSGGIAIIVIGISGFFLLTPNEMNPHPESLEHNIDRGDGTPARGQKTSSDVKGEQAVNDLAERCNELSEQSEFDYEVVSGKVIRTGIAKVAHPTDNDCFTEDCRMRRAQDIEATGTPQGFYYAVLTEIVAKHAEAHVQASVYMPPQTRESLFEGHPHMAVGTSYIFCAREIKRTSSNKLYQIDLIDTIKIKN